MHGGRVMHTVREAVQVQRRVHAWPLNLCVNSSVKPSPGVPPSRYEFHHQSIASMRVR
jgi:hypothetical protein